MRDATSNLSELKQRVSDFTAVRDWQRFHDLKSLSMALAIEAAELMEHFRWIETARAAEVMHDEAAAKAVREELADVLLFVAQFANLAGIDLMAAAEEKLALNEIRYPVEKCKGVATKYDKL